MGEGKGGGNENKKGEKRGEIKESERKRKTEKRTARGKENTIERYKRQRNGLK